MGGEQLIERGEESHHLDLYREEFLIILNLLKGSSHVTLVSGSEDFLIMLSSSDSVWPESTLLSKYQIWSVGRFCLIFQFKKRVGNILHTIYLYKKLWSCQKVCPKRV